MLVVGLDPSLTGTGVCVLRDGTIEKCVTLPNQPELKTLPRVREIRDGIMEIIENLFDVQEGTWQKPDLVVIEGFSFGSRGRALFETAYLGWRLREELELLKLWNEVPWIEFAPTEVKKFVTGKGNANKDVMMQQVYKKWGFEAKDNNQADAYALAKMGEDWLVNKAKSF